MKKRKYVVILLVGALVSGCGGKDDSAAEAKHKQDMAKRSVLVKLTAATSKPVEDVQIAVGRIESRSDPLVSAEVAGLVKEVRVEQGNLVKAGQVLAVINPEDYRLAVKGAQADMGRLSAVIEQQERVVERYEQLVKENYFSQNALDEVKTQLQASKEQLGAAQAQASRASNNLQRTEVRAPVAGRVERRLVSRGDFVGMGMPLFRLSTSDYLRVVLPFPEAIADQLAQGMIVRLTTPTAPDQLVEAKISELRPVVSAASRAIEVIVELSNPGSWRPGASANGEVVLASRDNAITVPSVSVVLRPKGTVVYVARDDGTVEERLVEVGVRRAGFVELTSGLALNEKIVADGASYLTDGAAIRVKQEAAE